MGYRIDPLVIQLRFYANDIDKTLPLAEMNEPYQHILTGIIMDNGVCRFTGSVHAIDKHRDEIKRDLKRMGVNKTEWRHKGIEHSFKI